MMTGTAVARAAVAAAALLVLAGSPAAAGDLAEIACPLENLGEEDRIVIGSLYMDKAQREPAIRAGAREVADCATRLEWSRAERAAASLYVSAFLSQVQFRQSLTDSGLDLARLERDVIADAALIGAAVASDRAPPELSAFMERFAVTERAWVRRKRHVPMVMHNVGGFVAATAVTEAARIRFTRG